MPLYMLVCCPRLEFKAVTELFMPKHQRRTYHMLLQKSAPTQSLNLGYRLLLFIFVGCTVVLLQSSLRCLSSLIKVKTTLCLCCPKIYHQNSTLLNFTSPYIISKNAVIKKWPKMGHFCSYISRAPPGVHPSCSLSTRPRFLEPKPWASWWIPQQKQ